MVTTVSLVRVNVPAARATALVPPKVKSPATISPALKVPSVSVTTTLLLAVVEVNAEEVTSVISASTVTTIL